MGRIMGYRVRGFARLLVNFSQAVHFPPRFPARSSGHPRHVHCARSAVMFSGPRVGSVRWMNMQTNLHDETDQSELSKTTRRVFCGDLLISAGLALAVPAATKAVAPQDSMVAYPARKIEGAEALLPGSSLYFNYPTANDPAVLLRLSDNEYRAYSRRCSHAGCSVDFHPSSRSLICPCHRGVYDARMGHVMFGPPQRPLDEIVFEVRAGGQFWAVGKKSRNAEIITQNLQGGD
jgi:arsenite oxidase small subunit